MKIAEREALRELLILSINDLLFHDFNKLVQLHYKVDVDEKKLKDLLRTSLQVDAAIIITDLLIQRQEEKIKGLNRFNSASDISDNEK